MTDRELLYTGLKEFLPEVSEKMIDDLLKFSALLLEKNKVMNLTAVTEPTEVVTRHFLDCAALAPHMPQEGRVLDVGTGAGFPGTHPEAVAAFWAARAAGEKASLTLYEVCRDGGLLCHALLYADGADTVTRTRVVWRDGAFCVGYADTYAVTALTYDGGMLTYVYDMPDNPPGTDHDGHIDTQETFTVG